MNTTLARTALFSACLCTVPSLAQIRLPPPPNPTPFTLSVAKPGSGSGHVASPASGIDCGSKCSNAYSPGVPVVLHAKGGSGLFTGWSGACSGSATSCSLVMDGAKTVSARFERSKLVVDRNQEVKDATVTSTPSGIQCGSACADYYDAGSRVSLFIHNLPDGYFADFGASGATVVMDKPVVQVRLRGIPSLRVAVSGPGKVTSQPRGISADGPVGAMAAMALGSSVNLRAAQGSVNRWSCNTGAQANCSQPGSQECTVVISTHAQTSCVALFQ